MAYKNHEGFPDPTAGEAINGVRREELRRLRWEELQQARERQHGIRRGEVLTLTTEKKQSDGRILLQKERVRVLELYRYHALVENQIGFRSCYQYWHMKKCMKRGDSGGK